MLKRKYSDPYHDPRWPKLRLAILTRDDRICRVRGDRCLGAADTCDHIVPWKRGGAWFDPANLRASCGPCNTSRRNVVEVIVDRTPAAGPSREW